MGEKIIGMTNPDTIAEIFGAFDANVKRIEKEFDVIIYSRDGEIRVSGEDAAVEKAVQVISYLEKLSALSGNLSEQNIEYAISAVRDGDELKAGDLIAEFSGKTLRLLEGEKADDTGDSNQKTENTEEELV